MPRHFCRIICLLLGHFFLVFGHAAAPTLITRLHPSAVLSESADGPSGLPQISADGRYVLFTSGANNVIDSEYSNLGISLYVHDRVTHTTVSASSTNGGWPGRGDAYNGSISADGKTVLFLSTSTNLGVADRFPGSPDIFQKDLQTGKITLITASATVGGFPTIGGLLPSMTPDARFVLFQSTAPNAAQLTIADTLGFPDVFVRDVAAQKTTLVSRRPFGSTTVTVANQASTPVMISTNGNFVLFYSLASDLISPSFNVFTQRLWLRDLTLQTNILISRGATNGNRESAFAASMSPDANVIAFAANARLEDINSPLTYSNVFARIMQTDTLKAMALPIDLKTNLSSAVTQVSPGGSRVAVTTHARVSGTNQPRLFIWDLPSDTMAELDLAPYGPLDGRPVQLHFVNDSTLFLGSTTNSFTDTITVGSPLTIRSIASTLLDASADGSVIAFAAAEALVAGDLNNESDVYVLSPSGLELISTAHPRWKRPLPDMSIHHLQNAPSPTDKIAFTSFSDALVANDTNGFADIFTWSKSSNQVRLESTALNGEGANGHSSDPALSRDGHWLAFISAASNLVANDTNHMEDVFLKSLDDGSIIRVSESVRPSTIKLLGVRAPILGNDGRFVAYTSTRSDMTMTNITSTTGATYLFDRSTGENLWIGAGLGTLPQQAVAIYAPNVYFFVRTNLYVFNVETRERTLIGPANTDPAFTSDGSLLALQLNISTNSQIYTYDPATLLTNVVLSFDQAGTIRSDPMSISDTKLVSFLSATSLAAADVDATNDVYTVNVNTPSPILVTTPQSLPRGSGALLPRNAVLSRDATLVYYLATTNSPIDLTPRTQLMIAEVKSGITTAVTATADGGLAPFISTKPILLSGGVATVTTARGLFDSPVDKGNLVYSTDVPDADGDGFPDFWEWQFFNNLNQTAGGDVDGDSMSNIDEILAGTNPTDASSVVSLTVQDYGSYLLISLRAPAQPIALEFTDDLTANNWAPLGVAPYGQNGLTVFQVNNESSSRFFRIKVVTP